MTNEPFVIERTFNAPIAKVWKAITDKNEMKQWYFDIAEFKPEVGFEFSFSAGAEGKNTCTFVRLQKLFPTKNLVIAGGSTDTPETQW